MSSSSPERRGLGATVGALKIEQVAGKLNFKIDPVVVSLMVEKKLEQELLSESQMIPVEEFTLPLGVGEEETFPVPVSPATIKKAGRSPRRQQKSANPNKPYNNYAKFEKMQKADTSKDWYVFNDGSKYVSKWEEEQRYERDCRDRKGNVTFDRHFGKASIMPLPDKFGVRNSGEYKGHVDIMGLVERATKTQKEEKWIERKGWIGNGDRLKPHYRRRVARGFAGYHDEGNKAQQLQDQVQHRLQAGPDA